ncbi:MAG: hypothetical protein JWL71_1954 [Acidobacteria bacterium]|nr:hypothetical protein [Acidobacteriota bacterium]
MPHQDRLNIAVFIDFDNIEIGVKQTLGQQFDVGIILDAIKERGEVVTKIAYADWTRSGEYSRSLTQHAIRLVQRNMTPGGDKNGADINLALDALEMAFTHSHINAYVIVGGDSDFLSLVEKLKQYDKKVFVVGGRAFTSMILQRNCHEFIAYENLAGVRKAAAKQGRPMPAAAANSPIAQALPVVRRALKILADREVTPQTGLLKSTLLQLDSTFSERNYGASSFLDFVEKLASSGYVHLKTSGRSVMVELNEGFVEEPRATGEAEESAALPAVAAGDAGAPQAPAHASAESRRPEDRPSGGGGGGFNPGAQEPAGPPLGDQAEGVRRAGEILGAATGARWPMYLRNVKQILRQSEGGFDERRYGFGGLMDLLKACQRENFVRVERDRRGGLRVFQGSVLQAAAPAPQVSRPNLPQPDVDEEFENQPIEAPRPEPTDSGNRADSDQEDAQPVLIDTTAELLGRAKPRKPRARAARPSLAAAPKKAAAKKPAVKKPVRGRKSQADDAGNR